MDLKVKLRVLIAGLVTTISALSWSQCANAATLDWHVKSDYPSSVSLKFYAKTKRHVWPGAANVWVLDYAKTYSFRLACEQGEKICYGAWPKGETIDHWGVGQNGERSCTQCCYICNGGSTQLIVLYP